MHTMSKEDYFGGGLTWKRHWSMAPRPGVRDFVHCFQSKTTNEDQLGLTRRTFGSRHKVRRAQKTSYIGCSHLLVTLGLVENVEEVVLTASGLDFIANSVRCWREEEVVAVVTAGDVVVEVAVDVPSSG